MSKTDVVFQLLAVSAKLERRLSTRVANVCGISFAEYSLLRALEERHNGSASRVELANTLNVPVSELLKALKPLEKTGYITTQASDGKARLSTASLTDTAQRVIHDTDNLIHDEIESMALPADMDNQVSQFLELLQRL